MKKLIAVLLLCSSAVWSAPVEKETYSYNIGPVELKIPLMTVGVVYLYDGLGNKSLVGAETTVLTAWKKVNGTVGMVTSPDGRGRFFMGADVGTLSLGDCGKEYISMGDIRLGAFGAYDTRDNSFMAGPKASILLW